jgi:hypothetical protein
MEQRIRPLRTRLTSLWLLLSILAAALFSWQPPAVHATAATALADNPFGVGVHLPSASAPTIPTFSSFGGTWARTDISWKDVETVAGQYNFSKFDGLMSQFTQQGVNVLVILDYQNPLYDGGNTPNDVAGFTAFATYSKAVLTHYPQVKYVEVWNEPNGGWFEVPAGTPQTAANYKNLLQYTYQAVKSLNTGVSVVGGVTYHVDTAWLEAVFKAGGLAYMDVVSDHPYSVSPEDGAIDQQQLDLQNLIKKYNSGNLKPIWASEAGWTSGSPDTTAGELQQADYLVRGVTLSLSAGVQKLFWYDMFKDPGGEPEWGLFHDPDASGTYAPKPAATAFKVLSQQVAGLTFARDEAIGPGLYDKVFGADTRVMWSTAGSKQVFLQTGGPLTTTKVDGTMQTLNPVNGTVTLTLTGSPYFVKGTVTAVTQTSVSGGSGTIAGVEAAAGTATINLTAQGRTDWGTWGAVTAGSYDRKSTGNHVISDFTAIGTGGVIKSGGGAPSLSWSDGTPDASGTNVAGVYTPAAGNGFQVTVPADTTKRSVKVYVNTWHSTGQLQATLSDGSGYYLDSSITNSSGTANGVYTLVYKANSANQTLTLTWTTKTDFGGGGVVLEAVALGPAFSTGFEAADLAPAWTDTVDSAPYPAGGDVNVGGICCGLTGPSAFVGDGAPLTNHTGIHGLLYGGGATSSSGADHAYLKSLDLSGQNVVVGPGTTLQYWINPESAANSWNYATGTNSTCVAVDLIFSDGSNLRDTGAVDQNGTLAHPYYQCNHLRLDTWNRVTVDIGAVANGKTVSRVDIGYDQPNVTGGYRGYIDDIAFIG